MKLLIIPAILENYSGLKDGGVKITLSTQEMNPQMMANVVSCHRKFCEVLIKEGEIDMNDMEEFKNHQFDEWDKRQDKTPSHRLRNVMYVLWEQDKQGYEIFKEYYEYRMEKIIEHLKSKIID